MPRLYWGCVQEIDNRHIHTQTHSHTGSLKLERYIQTLSNLNVTNRRSHIFAPSTHTVKWVKWREKKLSTVNYIFFLPFTISIPSTFSTWSMQYKLVHMPWATIKWTECLTLFLRSFSSLSLSHDRMWHEKGRACDIICIITTVSCNHIQIYIHNPNICIIFNVNGTKRWKNAACK